MDINDKTLVLSMLQLPRLGMTPSQIVAIEKIIDGVQDTKDSPRVLSFKEAAKMLGLSSKTSDRTVALWARQGMLTPVIPPGRHNAVGVTIDSVERMCINNLPTPVNKG